MSLLIYHKLLTVSFRQRNKFLVGAVQHCVPRYRIRYVTADIYQSTNLCTSGGQKCVIIVAATSMRHASCCHGNDKTMCLLKYLTNIFLESKFTLCNFHYVINYIISCYISMDIFRSGLTSPLHVAN